MKINFNLLYRIKTSIIQYIICKKRKIIKCFALFLSGDVKTTIKAGSKFNVTWHLGEPSFI